MRAYVPNRGPGFGRFGGMRGRRGREGDYGLDMDVEKSRLFSLSSLLGCVIVSSERFSVILKMICAVEYFSRTLVKR